MLRPGGPLLALDHDAGSSRLVRAIQRLLELVTIPSGGNASGVGHGTRRGPPASTSNSGPGRPRRGRTARRPQSCDRPTAGRPAVHPSARRLGSPSRRLRVGQPPGGQPGLGRSSPTRGRWVARTAAVEHLRRPTQPPTVASTARTGLRGAVQEPVVASTVRDSPTAGRLPRRGASVDAALVHRVLCRALSTEEIRAIASARSAGCRGRAGCSYAPSGGIPATPAAAPASRHRQDVIGHLGFAVRLFDRPVVDALATAGDLTRSLRQRQRRRTSCTTVLQADPALRLAAAHRPASRRWPAWLLAWTPQALVPNRGGRRGQQLSSPRQDSTPSWTARPAMPSPTTGSRHHQPSRGPAARPAPRRPGTRRAGSGCPRRRWLPSAAARRAASRRPRGPA
jgi:hypothetical protein